MFPRNMSPYPEKGWILLHNPEEPSSNRQAYRAWFTPLVPLSEPSLRDETPGPSTLTAPTGAQVCTAIK